MNGLAVKMLCENDPRFSWDIVDFSTDDKPGAYCIYEEKSGTVYVGRAANCHTRLSVHKSQLKRGVHYNRKLQSAHNNGGDLKKFVIEYCETMPTTNLLEVHWTRFFKSHGKDVFNQVVAYAEPLSKHSTSEECASMAASLGYLDNVDSHTRRLVLSTDSDPFIQSGEFGNIDLPLKRIETQSETSIALNETMGVTQVTRRRHGAATIQWAENMLLSGVDPCDVARQTGIKPGYARTLKSRALEREKRISPQPAREQDIATVQDFAPPVTVTETVTPVTCATKTPETRRFKITTLDVVFYATTLTTCAGLVTLLHWWGLPVALVYSLILVDAMETAKDSRLKESAQSGAVAVLLFEMIAGCVHTYLFNAVLWANYKSLPFRIGDKFVGEHWIVENEDKPFLIALGIALVLSGSAVYAIHKSIITAKERAKNLSK